MSYLVLARKFRPRDFHSVIGQEHVTRALFNSIKRGRISHAYLFSGPRGVGKTSVARILAKALNCVNGPTTDFLPDCPNCKDIEAGKSLAVREIDGASHNSVENVRELIDTLRSLPAPGSRYKIYIIDEVHMLSISAFNALLKSLEEPPPNTIFILATTELHKIPDTVISRCQRHDFRALNQEDIVDQLKKISSLEGIDIENESLSMIARMADGSMRDAQSLLDRVYSYSEGKVSVLDTSRALGIVDRNALLLISEAVLRKDPALCLSMISEIFSLGIDPRRFLNDFVSHWRDLLLIKFSGQRAISSLSLSEDLFIQLKRLSEEVSTYDLQDLVDIVRDGSDKALRSSYPKQSLEALLVRMATREPVEDIASIITGFKSSKLIDAKNNTTEKKTKLLETPSIIVKKNLSDELNWKAFVDLVSKSNSKMLVEYLKRLSIFEFTPGVLKGRAIKTVVDYVLDPPVREKLEFFLNQLEPCGKWTINIVAQDIGSSNENSLLAEEKKQKVSEKANILSNVESHPAIENLKKLFPGTTVDESLINKRIN